MNILIIGFGSIGKRHFEILSDFDNINSIDVVTKQNINNINSYKSLVEINDLDIYDYFIIASETIKHYEQLKFICSKVNNKKILVEKPLYDKDYDDIQTTNRIFTAYNLRFHPVLNKLKDLLKDKTIYYSNVICGQYLPTWRPEQDYTKSYSADINLGGGVLRDLSHELDYITWLFGDIERIDYINTKISDLEINSDDIFTSIIVTKNKSIVNLTVDYISKNPIRRLIIHTKDSTIEVDVIKNTISIYDKSSNLNNVKIEVIDRNYTYLKMHKSIIENDCSVVCSFKDGKKIVDIIENIEYKDM